MVLEETFAGELRVTLPPQPVWPQVTGLAIGMLLAGAASLMGVFLLVGASRGGFELDGALLGLGIAASFGGIVVHILLRLPRLARTRELPTVIKADAAGLSVVTARGGPQELLHYPVWRICGFGVYAGPFTLTFRRTMRLVMRLRVEGTPTGRETVVLEFEVGNHDRTEPLQAAFQQAMRLDPSVEAEARSFRWEMIHRRI
jgi:hypothetical protein